MSMGTLHLKKLLRAWWTVNISILKWKLIKFKHQVSKNCKFKLSSPPLDSVKGSGGGWAHLKTHRHYNGALSVKISQRYLNLFTSMRTCKYNNIPYFFSSIVVRACYIEIAVRKLLEWDKGVLKHHISLRYFLTSHIQFVSILPI